MKPRHAPASRANQAGKILAILRDFLGADLPGSVWLDVGCSDGALSHHLADGGRTIIGVDVDRAAVRTGANAHRIQNGAYLVASGQRLPFKSGAFDVIICAQVYEHVGDQGALADEVWRALRPGGVCFFSGPNRLAIMEEHYWLPFLSWLPRSLAHLYMRIFKRGMFYDAYPLLYWQIRKLWKAFTVHDYTARLLREPDHFKMEGRVGRLTWIGRLPGPVLRALLLFVPNYNWVLEKPA